MKILCKIFGHKMKRIRTIWPYEPGWAWVCKRCRMAIDFESDKEENKCTKHLMSGQSLLKEC